MRGREGGIVSEREGGGRESESEREGGWKEGGREEKVNKI